MGTNLDWPALWERCPELRPEGVTDSERTYFFRHMPEVYAALCLAAGVKWLANIGHQTLVIDSVGDDEWYVGADGLGAQGKGLDAALYAACVAVLDARDAKKQEVGR